MKKFIAFILCSAMLISVFMNGAAYAEENVATEKVVNYIEDLTANEFYELAEGCYISALIEFNYPTLNKETLEGLTKEEQIQTIQNYYFSKNQQIAETVGIPQEAVSSFAPFAEIRFDTFSEYEENKSRIYAFAESDDIVDIELTLFNNAECGTSIVSSTDNEFNLENIKLSYVHYVGYEKSGTDIKIGMLERLCPNSNDFSESIVNEKGEQKYNYDNKCDGCQNTVIHSEYHDHANDVATILHSFAMGATFYYSSIDNGTWVSSLDWLMSKGVHVVNMSYGEPFINYYDNRSAYVDHLMYENDCLIVIGAGNEGDNEEEDEHGKLRSSACSANAITVGASNINEEVADFSSYYHTENLLNKPDLLAPGDNVYVNGSAKEGTSYATPIVAGIAASLMDEYSVLEYNPQLTKAVLLQGCTSVSGQSEGFDQYAGAGIVNHASSRNVIRDNQYATYTKLTNGIITGSGMQKGIVIPANTTLNVYVTTLIPGSIPDTLSTDPYDDPEWGITSYNLSLVNAQTGASLVTQTLQKNTGYLTYENNTDKPIIVNLNISTLVNYNSDKQEFLAIATNHRTHTHDYSYGAHATSETSHTIYCACGARKEGIHAYNQTTDVECLVCGYDNSVCMYDEHVHEFTSVTSLSTSQHRLSCSCGETLTTSHYADSTDCFCN